MVMHFENCCCGCSLKTGSVIIGVLSAIFSLISLFLYIVTGYYMNSGTLHLELLKELDNQKDRMDEDQYNQAIKNLEYFKRNEGLIAWIFICLAVLCAIHLFMGILLVFGASKGRARIVKTWVVYAVISSVMGVILANASMIFYFVNGAVLAAVLGSIGLAAAFGLQVYIILVVNSFHTQLISINIQNKV